MQNQPLDSSDFEFLEDVLLKYGDDHSVLNVSELNGYFTALVSSPMQVDIAEWFPAIWGGQNPDWGSPEEGCRFIELSVRHMSELATRLAMQVFRARFEQTEHAGATLTLAEEWCFGYLRGITVSNWPELPASLSAKLQAITFCAEQDNFELPADLDVAQHCQRVEAIEPAAQALHDHWAVQR